MSTFRKKPVVIEAFRILSGEEMPPWFMSALERGDAVLDRSINEIDIKTLEGTMHADYGDWVIRGVKGEIYPCKPDIFDATYTPADAPLAEATVRITPDVRPVKEAIDALRETYRLAILGLDSERAALRAERDAALAEVARLRAREAAVPIAAISLAYHILAGYDYPPQMLQEAHGALRDYLNAGAAQPTAYSAATDTFDPGPGAEEVQP